MKKIWKIIIIISVIIAIVAGGYLVWRYLISPQKQATQTKELGTGTATGAFNIPIAKTDGAIFDYWVNTKSGEIYYLTEDGQIYKITSSGEKQATGAKATGNLSYVKPSTDGTLLLVAFGYPQKPTFAVYDLNKRTWQALPAETTAAAWDPKSNSRLVYLRDSGIASRLGLLTLADGKSKELLRLSQKDLDLDWTLPDLVYFKERPSGNIPTSLWVYNLKTQSLKTVAGEELGLSVKWSADGIGIKWSNGLNIIDGTNKILAPLNFKTLPSKCVFSEFRVYCAAPNDQSIIPTVNATRDDYLNKYLKGSVKFSDKIYSISLLDLRLGPNEQIQLFGIPIFNPDFAGLDIDADHLQIQSNQLLFINRYDNKLYSLSL